MVVRGVVGYALVFVGGLVVSVLPSSSPVLELPLVGSLRETMPGRMLGLTVVLCGLGLAIAAWLELVRYVGRGDSADGGARHTLVRRATIWWCVPLLLAPAMFSRDGWSYAAQGEMTRLGISPYVWSPSVLTGPIVEAVDPRWMHTITPYGPVPLVWGALAARLTSDPWLLVVAHRGLALVGLALLAYAVPRLASWAGRDAAVASALVLPSPLMLAHGVAGVHNDVVMAGLVALALVAAIEWSWVSGAVVCGLAAAVKLPAGLVGIGVALASLPALTTEARRLRRLSAVAAISVGTLFLVGVSAGVGIGWIQALGVPGEVRTPLSVTTQLGQLAGLLLEVLGIVGDEAPVVALGRGLGSLAALLVAGRLALRAATGVPASGVRAVALAMSAAVVLGPVVHPWYLLWAFPLLAACHLGARASTAILHLSWFLGLVAPLDGTVAGAGTAIALGLFLVAAITVAQMASHRSATQTEAAPAGLPEQASLR